MKGCAGSGQYSFMGFRGMFRAAFQTVHIIEYPRYHRSVADHLAKSTGFLIRASIHASGYFDLGSQPLDEFFFQLSEERIEGGFIVIR